MTTLRRKLLSGVLPLLLATTLGACTEPDPDLENVTTAGTIDLARVKIGTSDQAFQEAVVTFVRDMSAQANAGGKRQYLSRADGNTSGNAGQYMVQVRNGSCFEVTILYKAHPVSRDSAEADMKRLLPDGAPAQSRVDDGNPLKAVYYFGEEYLGELDFTDKTASKVNSLKVCNIMLLKQAQTASDQQKEELKPLVEQAKKDEETRKKP